MITNLQSIDPEKLNKEEWSRGDTWISLGRKNRIKVTGRLGVSGDWSRRDQVKKDRMEKESTGRDSWNWGHLGGGVKIYCSGNFLESMKVILIRARSNGDTESQQSQAKLPAEGLGCIQLNCWSRSPMEILKQLGLC